MQERNKPGMNLDHSPLRVTAPVRQPATGPGMVVMRIWPIGSKQRIALLLTGKRSSADDVGRGTVINVWIGLGCSVLSG